MVTPDRLELKAITLVRQTCEMGCGPTSIAMVLSGFGINTTEQALAEKYFPSALLPLINPNTNEINYNSGLDNAQLVAGMVRILEGMALQDRLRVDVFDASLWKETNSPQERYIVAVAPETIRLHGDRFKEDDISSRKIRNYYQTLESLVKSNKIVVYTANARMMQADRMKYMFLLPDEIRNGFYSELADFVKSGHIVGPHGGMTAHIRALDGSRTEQVPWKADKEGFMIVDPKGDNYVTSVDGLVWIDTLGVRGDVFDRMFRISLKDTNEEDMRESLNPQKYGIRSFLNSLIKLLPG